MPLVDAHCHLQDEQLSPLPRHLSAARRQGVTHWVCCGTGPDDWPTVRSLATRHRGVLPAFGLHPWRLAGCRPEWREALRAHLEAAPGAPLGEIGLDYGIETAGSTQQRTALICQLELAHQYRRPFVLHCHRAWGDLVAILRETAPHPQGFLVHGFNGSVETMRQLDPLGGYYSFSAALCNPQRQRLREALRQTRQDRLLFETDAPANTMDSLPAALHAAAVLLEASADTLAACTYANTTRLFGSGLLDMHTGLDKPGSRCYGSDSPVIATDTCKESEDELY